MAKYHFIVNPVAGGGAGLSRFRLVEAALRQRQVEYTVAYTEYPGHASELARRALQADYACIVAAGGDGTVRETAQELLYSGVPLGILPLGTGNDIIRTLGLPRDPGLALSYLFSGKVRSMDTLEVNGAVCLNAAGFGYDVEVLRQAQRYKARFPGTPAYVLGAIRALFHLRPFQLQLTTGGERLAMEALMVTFGNGTSIGGGMRVTPRANIGDGRMDLCIIGKAGALHMLLCLLRLIGGRHLGMKIVRYRQLEAASIHCTPETAVQLDGEIVDGTPVSVRIRPASLQVMAAE